MRTECFFAASGTAGGGGPSTAISIGRVTSSSSPAPDNCPEFLNAEGHGGPRREDFLGEENCGPSDPASASRDSLLLSREARSTPDSRESRLLSTCEEPNPSFSLRESRSFSSDEGPKPISSLRGSPWPSVFDSSSSGRPLARTTPRGEPPRDRGETRATPDTSRSRRRCRPRMRPRGGDRRC